PPKSTLLPYTTLFRSPLGKAEAVQETVLLHTDQVQHVIANGHAGNGRKVSGSEYPEGEILYRKVGTGRNGYPRCKSGIIGMWRLDRKSTRLNSSHVKI